MPTNTDDMDDDELFAKINALGLIANIASAPAAPDEVREAAEDAVNLISDSLKDRRN